MILHLEQLVPILRTVQLKVFFKVCREKCGLILIMGLIVDTAALNSIRTRRGICYAQ